MIVTKVIKTIIFIAGCVIGYGLSVSQEVDSLFSVISYIFSGGFLCLLLFSFNSKNNNIQGNNNEDTLGKGYFYANLYNTDNATGRIIAELDNLNKRK